MDYCVFGSKLQFPKAPASAAMVIVSLPCLAQSFFLFIIHHWQLHMIAHHLHIMKWRQNICFDFWVQFCTTTTTTTTTTPCVLCWNHHHHHHHAFLNTTAKNHIWKLWQNNTVFLQQNCLRSFADHIHKQTLQFLENCLLLLLRIGDDDLRGRDIKVLRRRREAVDAGDLSDWNNSQFASIVLFFTGRL